MIKRIILAISLFWQPHRAILLSQMRYPKTCLYNDQAAFVRLTPHGCSQSTYVIKTSHIKFDAIFSLILTVRLAGSQLNSALMAAMLIIGNCCWRLPAQLNTIL